MKLVVGLGNPGPAYKLTRHNAGFCVLDALHHLHSFPSYKSKFSGDFSVGEVHGVEAAFLKPMTFMNLSGDSVQKALLFFRIPLASVVVVHDELDLPFGTVRVKVGGGHAGHNGIRSLVNCLGGHGFSRVRVGIGRPSHPGQSVADYVLENFRAEERFKMETDILKQAMRMVESMVCGVAL